MARQFPEIGKTEGTDHSHVPGDGIKGCQDRPDGKAHNKMSKNAVIEAAPPVNRVIRKRIAARTIGIHLSALPPELRALHTVNKTDGKDYLVKHDIPDKIPLTDAEGTVRMFSRDEAWAFADKAGAELEWSLLSGMAGKVTALFSSAGQGVYANYGRPTVDFSGFFHDHMQTVAANEAAHALGQPPRGSLAAQRLNDLRLGPIMIAIDTASAAGFTALGHASRGASLTDSTVLTDMVSTGVYEGSSAWATAKLGVLTGAKAMGLTAALPIPGAQLAAIPVGFLVGAATAIVAKRVANDLKDAAVDAGHEAVDRPGSSLSFSKLFVSFQNDLSPVDTRMSPIGDGTTAIPGAP